MCKYFFLGMSTLKFWSFVQFMKKTGVASKLTFLELPVLCLLTLCKMRQRASNVLLGAMLRQYKDNIFAAFWVKPEFALPSSA